MNLSFSNFEKYTDSELLLTQPEHWLPLLACGDGAELFFFSLDLNHRLRFLSESAWSIGRIRSEEWLLQSLQSFLTDHTWNSSLARLDSKLEPGKVHRMKIEVWDFERSRVKLETWRKLILWQDEPLGIVGMARRFHDPLPAESLNRMVDPIERRRQLETLTSRELEVVELVVQGELNKSIAKKLNIALRTVEARRSKAMAKLGCLRLSDLIRFWILAKESPELQMET